MSIVKDLTNGKYQYFVKFRLNDKLMGTEPKYKELKNIETTNPYLQDLAQFNDANFVYLPLIFNAKKLKSIHKNIDDILSTDNPQILIKSEQLRLGSKNNPNKSKKIHVIFQYEETNQLATVINKSLNQKKNPKFNYEKYDITPTPLNTIAADINLKHNLLAASNGKIYDAILKPSINLNSKNNLIHNINQIITIHRSLVL
jgi:hypothetical protein